MSFQPGERVALIGYAIPMTVERVERVDGDDVYVVRFDAKGKTIRESFKSGALQPAPRRGGAIRFTF